MAQKDKKITVLMPVYNIRKEFLDKSVASILSQTYGEFEFLIIDDGCTDKDTINSLNYFSQKDSRVRLIRNEKNSGITKSLNRGIKEAQGRYIARIDADDWADTARLARQLRFMEDNPDCALCGSWSHIIDEKGSVIGQKKFSTRPEEIRKKILYFNFFTHSSLFFRKDVVQKIGGYSEKIKKAQDYDLILKIAGQYPIANIAEFLCYHRIHPDSISSKGKKKQEWFGLIARWNAIFKYGHPKLYFWKIIPAFFYFLFVPYFLEKLLFKQLLKNNV